MINASTSLQSNVANHGELESDVSKVISHLQSFLGQGSAYLEASRILSTNQNYILSQSLDIYTRTFLLHQPIAQDSLLEIDIQQHRLNYFLKSICDIYLRSMIYTLLMRDREPVETFQDVFFLTDKYLKLGGNITNIFGLLHSINIIAVMLIDRQEISSELNNYLEYVVKNLLSQFSDVINNTDFNDPSQIFAVNPEDLLNREYLNLLQRQYQSLVKLSEEWLAGDAEEQTETWNYLRDALNPESPSYSPVII